MSGQKAEEPVKKLKIRPTLDRVNVIRENPDEKTKGGLYMPENSREQKAIGRVQDVGPGRYQNGTFVPTTSKIGDRVIYAKYAGTEFKLPDGQKVFIINQEDILATLE